MASSAAYNSFVRVFSDPEGEGTRGQFDARQAHYRYLWHLYKNSAFDDLAHWAPYRQRYALYRHIRPIYNPARRLIDFYAATVYPGVLSFDAEKLPDGTPLAIPLNEDIDDGLREAIGQLWQWSNWQSGKSLMVRYGAALGDVFVEVVDEVDRGKVTFDIVWPGLVRALELDATGNVKAYSLEYDALDADGTQYKYRKEVDSERIAEYRDDALYQFDEGIDAERPNPYGFAPAIWCKHVDLGGDHGDPALRNIGKIDELNEMASHAHDRAHAVLSSPILFSGENVGTLDAATTTGKRSETSDQARTADSRESVRIIKSGPSGSVSAVQLPEGEMVNYMDRLLSEIESDHPELTMYKHLREMSAITGPAAAVLVGDTAAYVNEARANYDTQSIKLFQMTIAIGGWRLNTGAWGRQLTSQQQVFAPFDLESYQQGALDFEILPRPLIPPLPMGVEERRVWMEAGERGYVSDETVTGKFVGDVEAERARIEETQAAALPSVSEIERQLAQGVAQQQAQEVA